MTCPGSHSWEMSEAGIKIKILWCTSPALSPLHCLAASLIIILPYFNALPHTLFHLIFKNSLCARSMYPQIWELEGTSMVISSNPSRKGSPVIIFLTSGHPTYHIAGAEEMLVDWLMGFFQTCFSLPMVSGTDSNPPNEVCPGQWANRKKY